MKQILSVLVNNSSGVLSHVSGLFTRRGYNIDSLSVGETEDPSRSVITLVVNETDEMVRQIEKQLYKLVEVISIENLTYEEAIQRELIIMVVNVKRENRAEVLSLVEIFQGHVTDMTDECIMIEVTGIPRRIAALIAAMSEFGIRQMARTGTVSLAYPSGRRNGKG